MNYHFLRVTFLDCKANSMFSGVVSVLFPQDSSNFPNRSQAIFVGEVSGADGCSITRYPLCFDGTTTFSHTVDGCEILHQLVDGLSHDNLIMIPVLHRHPKSLTNWCRMAWSISQYHAFHMFEHGSLFIHMSRWIITTSLFSLTGIMVNNGNHPLLWP